LTGLAFKTVYVTFERPTRAAVKLVNAPLFFETWAASIQHQDLSAQESRIIYTLHFMVKPRLLRPLLDPLIERVFRWETAKRLRALQRHFARETTSYQMMSSDALFFTPYSLTEESYPTKSCASGKTGSSATRYWWRTSDRRHTALFGSSLVLKSGCARPGAVGEVVSAIFRKNRVHSVGEYRPFERKVLTRSSPPISTTVLASRGSYSGKYPFAKQLKARSPIRGSLDHFQPVDVPLG